MIPFLSVIRRKILWIDMFKEKGNAMKISDNGLNLIKKFEGCRLTAYQDAVGREKKGYGRRNTNRDACS